MSADEDQDVVEFDVVAAWTAEVLAGMDGREAIVGACRGSANPAALAWLAEALALGPGVRLLDSGGGLGGPAAWAATRYGVRVVTSEPMGRAAGWARRLFGLPSVVADSVALPLDDGAIDVVWALGVLSTVDDKPAFLAEARRVLRPGGRLGLLEYVRTDRVIGAAPAGNDFLDADDLDAALDDAGFDVMDRAAPLPPPPAAWASVGDRVAAALAAAHPGAPELDRADEAERRFGELLGIGTLVTSLVVAVRR